MRVLAAPALFGVLLFSIVACDAESGSDDAASRDSTPSSADSSPSDGARDAALDAGFDEGQAEGGLDSPSIDAGRDAEEMDALLEDSRITDGGFVDRGVVDSGLSDTGVDATPVDLCSYFRGATGLRYFGFYCSSCDWVGDGSYAEEIRTLLGANVSFISGEPPHIRAELEKAERLGMRAIVSLVNGIFRCDYPAIPAPETHYCFLPDGPASHGELFFERWTPLVPDFERYIANGTLIAFYVGDDRSPADTDPSNAYLRRIRATFSQPVKFMVALLPFDTQISREVDWVAWEHYDGGGPTPMERAALREHQQLVLMPGVYVDPMWHRLMPASRVVDTSIAPLEGDPRVVMIMPFLWQTIGTMMGARDIPTYRSRMFDLAGCFAPVLRDAGVSGGVADAGID